MAQRKPADSQKKLVVPATKKRNPLVAPALQRKAGSHTKDSGAKRAEEKAVLRKKLSDD